jgi:hypothetical protein
MTTTKIPETEVFFVALRPCPVAYPILVLCATFKLEGDVEYSWRPSRSKFKKHTFAVPTYDEESSDDREDTVTWLKTWLEYPGPSRNECSLRKGLYSEP